MPIGNALSVIRRFRPFPPVITSDDTITWELNKVGFDYQITATNDPTSFGATPIPAGLKIDTTNGHLSGKPTAISIAGTNVTISAKNQTGTGTKILKVIILPPLPVITSALTKTGTKGVAFSYNIVATNMSTGYGPPLSYTSTALPPGLTLNATSGLINGTPTVDGFYSVDITATNAAGSDTKTLDITINLAPPVVTQPPSFTRAVNTAFSYTVQATNSPTSYSATGLPSGLSIDTNNGQITGTLPNLVTNQTFTVTVNATNGAGSGSKNFIINVIAPPIINANNFGGQDGTSFGTTATATNGPVTWSLSNLPSIYAGASISSTGVITGIGNSRTDANDQLTINATNIAGTGSTTVTVFVWPPPPPLTAPTITSSTLTFSVKKGTRLNYQITADGNPASFTYTLSNAAAGWSVNSSGLISGVCNTAGTGTWTMTVTNSQGTATARVGWGVSP